MRLPRRWLGPGAALLAASNLPLGCAQDGAVDDARPLETPSMEVPDANSSPDALADGDAGPVTNGCSASNLCIVDAPIDDATHLTSVRGSGPDDVWAVGAKGTILHYDGQGWDRADLGEGALDYTVRTVWLERPNDVWMIEGAYIRHSTGWRGPNATEWSRTLVGGEIALRARFAGRSGEVWLTGGSGSSFLRKYAGWLDGEPGASVEYAAPRAATSEKIVMSRANEMWIVALGAEALPRSAPLPGSAGYPCVFRGSLATGGADATWAFEEHDARTTRPLLDVWGDDSGVWLVGEGGTLRHMPRTEVRTKKFEIVASPVTAALRGVFGFGPDDIWAVGDDATVIHWDGTSWTKLSTPFDDVDDKPILHAVWGSSPDDVWIAGRGTILHFKE